MPESYPWSVALNLRGLLGLLAQPRDRLADDPRDVHLGDADAGADLRLGQVLGEAQPQHLALSLREHGHEPVHGGGVLGEAEARVLGPEALRDRLVVVVVAARAVERD